MYTGWNVYTAIVDESLLGGNPLVSGAVVTITLPTTVKLNNKYLIYVATLFHLKKDIWAHVFKNDELVWLKYYAYMLHL